MTGLSTARLSTGAQPAGTGREEDHGIQGAPHGRRAERERWVDDMTMTGRGLTASAMVGFWMTMAYEAYRIAVSMLGVQPWWEAVLVVAWVVALVTGLRALGGLGRHPWLGIVLATACLVVVHLLVNVGYTLRPDRLTDAHEPGHTG